MSDPDKDNTYIFAHHDEFQQAYALAQTQFKQIDGVAGVGFGLKQVGSNFTDNIAIIVCVIKKKDAKDIPAAQQIPPRFQGFLTDVLPVADVKDAMGCENEASYDVIQGGIQIGIKSGTGTLGCIVKRRNDSGRENVYLLTNKHVLYDEESGTNHVVYHPFHPDNGTDRALGPIVQGFRENVQRTEEGQPVEYYVDAAIARIDLDSACCGSVCTKDKTHVDDQGAIVDMTFNGGKVKDVRDVRHDETIIYTSTNKVWVYKHGARTRKTMGRVVRVNVNALFSRDKSIPNSPQVLGANVIQIIQEPDPAVNPPSGMNCQGNLYFGDEGDSGSLVVDEQGRAIGLFMGTIAFNNVSNACAIVPVLDALNVSIVCAGTSHGSINATDGSGVAVVAEAGSDLADGQIAFAHDGVAGPFGLPAPVPVSDDEQRYMSGLLERLRRTRRGRALHDLFGRVRREVGYLVRNHKLVKVAWHRYKGPAFLALTLDHIKGNAERVPREVGGVSVVTLLTRMAEVLTAYGSNAVREAIETHRDEIAQLLASESLHTVDDCLAYLESREGDA